jgi:hypothetical protein
MIRQQWWPAFIGGFSGVVLVGLVSFAPASLYKYYEESVPASRWFEVGGITVDDTVTGVSPLVHVDRTIKQPFSGRWTVTVRRVEGKGLVSHCDRSGQNDYLTDSVLPAQTDLEWWMEVPPNRPCPPLAPGRYVVTVRWLIELPDRTDKEIRVTSNQFQVLPLD